MSKKSKSKQPNNASHLPPFDKKKGSLQVVIETPKGSRNKYAFDEKQKIFALKRVLPAGMAFPYDFGFIPSTIAEDGDPVDVLALMVSRSWMNAAPSAACCNAAKIDQLRLKLIALLVGRLVHAALDGQFTAQVADHFISRIHAQHALGANYFVRGTIRRSKTAHEAGKRSPGKRITAADISCTSLNLESLLREAS